MAYIYNLIDTWNNAGTTFTAIKMNVTDTNSSASSLLMDLQVGAVTQFNVRKDGSVYTPNGIVAMGVSGAGPLYISTNSSAVGYNMASGLGVGWTNSATNAVGAPDTILRRDAAATLAQRNSTNAQTYRLYGTYTDASNYERGYLTTDSNGFTIGTEALGTGTKRPVRIIGPSLASAESVSILELSQTWNTSGTPTGLKLNVTDTASNAASLLMDLQVGGSSKFNITKTGAVRTSLNDSAVAAFGQNADTGMSFYSASRIAFRADGGYAMFLGNSQNVFPNGRPLGFEAGVSGTPDLILARDAANKLALRNGAVAQAFNIYNTFTDASNYERGYERWNSNVYEVGVEAAGSGITNRSMRVVAGGQLNLQAGSGNSITFNANLIASVDNTYDIGASGATRPRNVYVAGEAVVGDNSGNNGKLTIGIGLERGLYFGNRGRIGAVNDGVFALQNNATTGFDRLQFGGSTSAFPALKRSGAALQVRLADDTADAAISASTFTASSSAVNISALASTGYSLTGSSTVSMVDLAGTWNTTGAPTGIKMNVTDVASSNSSLLMDLQTNGSSRFKVAKDGAIEARTITTTSSSVNLSAISSTGHSLTGSSAVSLVDLSGTWNTSGTPTAFKMNIINTASNAASLLMDLQTDGASKFKVRRDGAVTWDRYLFSGYNTFAFLDDGNAAFQLGSTAVMGWTAAGAYGGAADTVLRRDGAANTLALRNSTAAQAFNIYDTYTDASNYRRTSMYWSGGVFYIDNDLNAGTGITNATMYIKTRGNLHLLPGAGGYDVVTNGNSGGSLYPGGTTNTTNLGRSDKTFAIGYFGTSTQVAPATAIPAGGTAGLGYRVSSTANFGVFFGSGAPTLSAAKGSLYLRSDGTTTNDRMYVNTDGSTTWTAVITAS